MKTLPLNTPPFKTIIDDELFDEISQFHWYVRRYDRPARDGGSKKYAYRFITEKGQRKKIHLHREVMRLAGKRIKGKKIDHINGDCLDNRLENLRFCTDAQNLRNQAIRAVPKTSRFKGVSQSANHSGWRASIFINYKRIHLGYFPTEEEAARAYDLASLRLHGKFGRTNAAMELI